MGGRTALALAVKLLLDEMHDPAVAELLRGRGHDARAIAEIHELRGMSDRDVLFCAALDGRVLVTENVKDFAPLHAALVATDVRHAGVIFTHPRRFPRAAPRAASRLAEALSRFLTEAPTELEGTPFVWWLA